MSTCHLDENIVPGNCHQCDSELKELLLYRTFILDAAKAVESGSFSHTDLANEVMGMAEDIRGVGWPMRDLQAPGDTRPKEIK